MKIHNVTQGSQEWLDIRAKNFTASELDTWAIEPVQFSLNVEEIKEKLDRLEISRKGVTKKDDLIQLLPFPAMHMELTKGARTAIIKKIVEAKEKDEWQLAIEDQRKRQFEYNMNIQRGNALEPEARSYYEIVTGYEVAEVGFCEADGFGCSPDGLIGTWETVSIEPDQGSYNIQFSQDGELLWMVLKPTHGLEIKCPSPETHIDWLLAGTLPDDHKLQVHASMIVCGVRKWDFLSYSRTDAPMILTAEWNDFTDQLEAGLKRLVSEKAKIKSNLAAIWAKAFPNA
jgi:hypothetical protein